MCLYAYSLIIGTLDGANIEIGEEIGFDNMFIFGAKTEDVPHLRAQRPDLQASCRPECVCLTLRLTVAPSGCCQQCHMRKRLGCPHHLALLSSCGIFCRWTPALRMR